jgi:hypothetical protein
LRSFQPILHVLQEWAAHGGMLLSRTSPSNSYIAIRLVKILGDDMIESEDNTSPKRSRGTCEVLQFTPATVVVQRC